MSTNDLVERLYQTYDYLIKLPVNCEPEFDPTEPMLTAAEVKRLLRISQSNYVEKLRLGAIRGYAPPGRPNLVLGLHSFYDVLALRTMEAVPFADVADAEEALDQVAEILNSVGSVAYCREAGKLFFGVAQKMICSSLARIQPHEAINVSVAYCTYRLGLSVQKLLAEERSAYPFQYQTRRIA